MYLYQPAEQQIPSASSIPSYRGTSAKWGLTIHCAVGGDGIVYMYGLCLRSHAQRDPTLSLQMLSVTVCPTQRQQYPTEDLSRARRCSTCSN
jgi:hypothetical protein